MHKDKVDFYVFLDESDDEEPPHQPPQPKKKACLIM
jgi:hypothetical protein